MNDAITEIRVRAEILHRRAAGGDPAALRRFSRTNPPDMNAIRRTDCLAVLARELGFDNWPEAKKVLSGHSGPNAGTFLCPPRCAVYLNHWCKTRAEAISLREASGGFLLAYRAQYLVVQRDYIETLGLDPDDSDWITLGLDWTREDSGEGECVAARARLTAKLLTVMPRESLEPGVRVRSAAHRVEGPFT